MSRLIQTVVKKGVRNVIQNVNQYVGRAVSTQDSTKKPHDGEDWKDKDYRHDFSQENRWDGWEARKACSNPFWVGTVVAAGIQLSKIVSEVLLKDDSFLPGKRKLSLLEVISGTVAPSTISCMRDAGTLNSKSKPVPNKTSGSTKLKNKDDKTDQLDYLLLSSDEEICSMMNRRGARCAENGDWKAAVKWFSSAAKEGYPPAQFNLALYYHTVDKDVDRARCLYEKAAEKGHKEAAYNLSTILLEQRSPDWETLMVKAADLGVVVAQNFLADHYFTHRRFEDSRLYYQKVQLSGDEAGVCDYWIGRCHEADGNLLMAELWYQRAALKPDNFGLDAAVRLSGLGRTRPSRKITESSSATFLLTEIDKKSKTLSASLNPDSKMSRKPFFFIPSDETGEVRTHDTNPVDLFPYFSLRNESIRRSHSSVECR